jgi:hypothetical protein
MISTFFVNFCAKSYYFPFTKEKVSLVAHNLVQVDLKIMGTFSKIMAANDALKSQRNTNLKKNA